MSWRTAKSLLRLRDEVNAARPNRSKVSDGTIGDAGHRTRTSDHNPWVPPPNGGVVTAMDFTDDLGTLGTAIAEHLRTSRDSRVKYVISEGRMFSSYATSRYPAWTWRPYSGSNGHFSHTHVSVQPHNYDDERPWGFSGVTEDASMEELITGIQEAVKEAGHDPGPIDGAWGPRTQAGLTAALKSGTVTTSSEGPSKFLADMERSLVTAGASPTSLTHVLDWFRRVRESYPDVKPGP